MKKISTNSLLIGGLHMGGDGYPNARQTLHILQDRLQVQIIECGAWFPDSMQLWRLGRARFPTKIAALSRLFFGNLVSVLKVISKQGPERTLTYIPYPAIFFLWWSSWIPARWRPRCISDSYISIWDSMYRDRSNDSSASLAARLLKLFESRALRAAKLVLVDTLANKYMFVNEFGLEEKSILALPLAIKDERFLNCPPRTEIKDKTLTVLFVGTLIPLHGIKTILEAIQLLMPDLRFRFHLLGDGQLGHLVENFSTGLNMERFLWTRGWADLQRIADEICKADICLGVFGGEGKAARVLPFKVYMYLASGRAIVTQSSFSLPESMPLPPMLTVPVTSARDVADAITRLADDNSLRNKLASDARAYYIEYLGHERLASVWKELLARLNTKNH